MEKQKHFLKITIFETLDTDFSYLLQILAGSIRLIISTFYKIILSLFSLFDYPAWFLGSNKIAIFKDIRYEIDLYS